MRRKPPALLFVLPNLFTVSSIFCGFYAIVTSMDGSGPDRFYRAAVAILFAVVFDCADGRVARMTKTQSDFGVQLDSLADVISFGLAPALLVYEWALRSLGPAGIAICFIYAACGALRLARFNVMTQDQSESPTYFTGLPIPVAAASIVSLVLAHYRIGGGNLGNQPVMAVVMLLLSLLMVSSIHYRTFKKLPQHRLTMAFVLFGHAGGGGRLEDRLQPHAGVAVRGLHRPRAGRGASPAGPPPGRSLVPRARRRG